MADRALLAGYLRIIQIHSNNKTSTRSSWIAVNDMLVCGWHWNKLWQWHGLSIIALFWIFAICIMGLVIAMEPAVVSISLSSMYARHVCHIYWCIWPFIHVIIISRCKEISEIHIKWKHILWITLDWSEVFWEKNTMCEKSCLYDEGMRTIIAP